MDFFCGKAEPKEALPVGVVLTIPAAEVKQAQFCNNQGRRPVQTGMYSELIRPVLPL